MKLAFTAYGEGQPLIVLHGLFGSSRNWASIARTLASGRRVLAVDLRNHGASPWDAAMDYPAMADDVLALIEVEKLDRPVLLGHSMGGKAAMTAALADPSAIAALIVADIAPVPYGQGHDGYLDAMRALDLAAVGRRSDADDALHDAVPEPALRGFLLQNLVFEGGGAHWRLNLDAIARHMDALTGFPEPPAGRVYAGPSLFLAGGRSPYVKPDDHAAIRRLFPAADIRTIKDAGHWLHAERPAEFVDLVSGFLSGLE